MAVLALVAAGVARLDTASAAASVRQMEYLDRGLVAVKVAGGVYLSWRLLGNEPSGTTFNLYRGTTRLGTGQTNYTDAPGTTTTSYRVAPVINGVEGVSSPTVRPMANQYSDIKLQRPPAAVTPMIQTYATTTTGKQYEPVNMDLLRRIRDAGARTTGLTRAEFSTLIAPFRTYFRNANWAPTNPFGTPETLVSGDRYRISAALNTELQAAFRRYVDELDRGPTLPYLKKADGSIDTALATYSAGDASVGDLDGDGAYELILKWEPSNGKDSSQVGVTAPTIIDAYKLDGTLLWRVNVGYNIRAGAHDTQLVVADFNGDGRAELIIKTADGTQTGVVRNGQYVVNDVVGDPNATPDKIRQYIAAGDAVSLDRYHDAMHGYSVGWVAPGGNTPVAQNTRQWAKIYTYGPIGTSNEYLTAFDGRTGRVIDTAPYAFPHGEANWGAAPENERGAWFGSEVDPYWTNPATRWGHYPWGDPQGNRGNRFLAGAAYLDGVRPSAVMARGYYDRTTLAAYTLDSNNKLVLGRTFDSLTLPDPDRAEERGAHSLTVSDVDNDGRDEIVYGAMVLDDDLTVKSVANTWFPYPAPATGTDLTPRIKSPSSTARWVELAHGDALHAGDFNPSRPGTEVFMVQESYRTDAGKDRAGNRVEALRPGGGIYDPVTGALQTAFYGGKDVGRGVAANIDPNSPGAEYWADGSVYSAVTGQRLYASTLPVNFLVYWDGDLTREILDSNRISKANTNYTTRPTTMGKTDLLVASGATAINGSKSTPVISADLFGDWREEVVWKVGDDTLRLYTTTIPTRYKIHTLMHDPQYRMQVAAQNTTYNQPPHPSFYLDASTALPPQRTDIDVTRRS